MFNPIPNLMSGILLAFPALVLAEEPIYVEYETHIPDRCDCEGSPYAPGERVAGWLRIDPDLAPPGRFPDNPEQQRVGTYWESGTNGRNFISGFGWRTVWFGDEIGVVDDDERRSHQSYSIWDHSLNPNGGSTLFELQIYSDDRLDDFIHGMGLAQSFDTDDMKGDFSFRGVITHNLMGVRRAFDLVLDRLSVTPGRCGAP